MIKFDVQNKVFYLNTKNTTYAFGVFKNEVLAHLYWGKLLKNDLDSESIYSEYSARNLSAFDLGNYSTDLIPLEFSAYGGADQRTTTFKGVHSDGSRVSRFSYVDYEIKEGKSKLSGLPATYCEKGDKVDTLTVHLVDSLKNLHIYLDYTVFEDYDAITRSMRIVNEGEKFRLTNALSTTVDFVSATDMDVIHLDGAWARERFITRNRIVKGNQNVESFCGASSAYHNPFVAICEKDATEQSGNVYGLSLVYSGNFTAGAQMNPYDSVRAYIGINPFEFEFVLENGDTFQTPEAVLVYSAEGIGGMSRKYHKLYRERLCRGKYRDADRFVLINNWEATYFNFNEEKIVNIAKKAKEIGIDTMVLDDGWFGKRINDKAGLGDWYENTDRLPNGLKGLAQKVNDLGMRFGLWFEPEMVNPDSDLYRNRPDWVIHTVGRERSLTRNQLVLDLSRKEVCDYIIDSVSAILEKANIEYVKWDMNRYMSEVGSAGLLGEKQGEVMHRYMLGLYYVLETIVTRFPNVLFESCASGGSRFDPGMLHYMPQTWTSDDSDAVERLSIQYGTSIVYPFSAMGAHVSACPNHQVGRTTPFKMRCDVALPGQFGFELDLNACTEKEIEQAKASVEEYRKLQQIFHKGDCYRLVSPFEKDLSVLEFVSEDKNTVVLCVYCKKATPNSGDMYIKLCGLDEEAKYLLEGTDFIYGGDFLQNRGYHVTNGWEYSSKILVFNKK